MAVLIERFDRVLAAGTMGLSGLEYRIPPVVPGVKFDPHSFEFTVGILESAAAEAGNM